MALNYVTKTGIQIIRTKLSDCAPPVPTFKASGVGFHLVTNVSDLTPSIELIHITIKQVIYNDGSTPQDDIYEAALNVTETVESEFSSELSQFSSVIFANGLQIEPKVTLLTTACPELEIGYRLEHGN